MSLRRFNKSFNTLQLVVAAVIGIVSVVGLQMNPLSNHHETQAMECKTSCTLTVTTNKLERQDVHEDDKDEAFPAYVALTMAVSVIGLMVGIKILRRHLSWRPPDLFILYSVSLS